MSVRFVIILGVRSTEHLWRVENGFVDLAGKGEGAFFIIFFALPTVQL